MTPEVPVAASPPKSAGKVSEAAAVQIWGAVLFSVSVKLFVVPESSARCTAVMAALGREAFGFVFAIAGSFHLVIFPAKMPASVAGSRVSSLTPSMLNTTAIGEM